ncbi:unnamed protein product [Urochloa humidicola]
MSFYLDRLEAARRQRMVAGCAPPPRPCNAAALLPLPRSPAPLPVRSPLHSGVAGWDAVAAARWVAAGGRVGDGAAQGGAGSTAPAREEAGGAGGGEARSKRCSPAPSPDLRSPPPKRRAAVPAFRRFPPGCGRDAAEASSPPPLPVPGAGCGDSRPEPSRRGGGTGVLSEAAAASPNPSPAASAPNKVAPGDATAAGATADCAANHRPRAAPVKPSEAPKRNSVTVADTPLFNDTGSPGRLLPEQRSVSAFRRFPLGCGRPAAPLLAGGGSSQVCSVQPVPQDPAAPVCNCTEDGAAAEDEELELEEGEVTSEAQESPSATTLQTACRHGTSSSEDMTGNAWQCEHESKSGWSSCNVESLPQRFTKEHMEEKDERVSECAMTDTAYSSVGPAMMGKKVMFTARKSVKPPKLVQKPAPNTPKEAETELGRHTSTAIEHDTNDFTKDRAVQDPMSEHKCPWTNKANEAATVSHYFGPKKKKVSDNNKDSILKDGGVLKALATVHEGKFEHEPHRDADARSKVKTLCSRFESICRSIVQAVEQRSLKVRRIDLAADKLIRNLPGFTKPGPIVGNVPGVEVGDEFLYRVQLALVGLHRPYQGGIDTTRDEHGMLIAISVVASGGYPDELSCPGELIYTGSGGKKGVGDQKLEHGNLALRNCVERKSPVRVIHGFKCLNREGGSHSRANEVSRFTYDGLYRVVKCWREGPPGSKVFKYKLQRIPGQPGLPLHVARLVRKNNA